MLAALQRIAERELELTRTLHLSDELFADAQLDSMGLTVLAVALEDHFRVRLDEEDAPQLHTVGDLVHLLCRRLAERAEEPRA